ncbi:MAG: DMT family transporter [Nitriliruptoraceae bacterium]|nr:DMT family transporter [Nitriliruptoraceae bacterium]
MSPSVARGFGPAETILLLALSAMWGLSFLFIELALRELGPLWIVAGRTATGGAVLVVLCLLRGRRMPATVRLWGHLLVLGTINNAVPWTAVAWAQQSLPSGLTALLMAIVPTSTLLVSAAIGLERITGVRLVGLLLALGGVGAIVAGDLEQPGRVVAVLAVVAATLLYASGAVYAKTFVSGALKPLPLAAGQVVSAAVVVTPIAVLFESLPPNPAALATTTVVAVSLLGALGTGLAFLVFYMLIERVGATNATMTTYLIPLVAIVAGFVVLDERLGLSALIGGTLIVAGIYLAQRGTRAGASPVPEPGVDAPADPAAEAARTPGHDGDAHDQAEHDQDEHDEETTPCRGT